MTALIDSLRRGVPAALPELATSAEPDRRAADVLAYVDRPGISNGPTEAINGGSNTYPAPPWVSAASPTT